MKLERILEVGDHDLRMRDRVGKAIVRRGSQDGKIENILNAFGCRAAFRQGATMGQLNPGQPWIKNASKLAYVLRVMKISVDELIDRAPAPFEDWRDGSRILFILGKREGASTPESEAASMSQAVSDFDLGGYKGIVQYLQQSLYMRLDFENWEAGLPSKLARPRFDQLLKNGRADLGAVIVLGSPAVNPAAEVVSKKILQGAESPGRFRFNRDMMAQRDDGNEPLLQHPEPCEPANEGIQITGSTTTLLRKRVGRGTRREVKDCGMLLMSIHTRPLLILAAGHGALGTLAAAYGLTASWKMDSICSAATKASRAHAHAFVKVSKIELGEQEGEGWKFITPK